MTKTQKEESQLQSELAQADHAGPCWTMLDHWLQRLGMVDEWPPWAQRIIFFMTSLRFHWNDALVRGIIRKRALVEVSELYVDLSRF